MPGLDFLHYLEERTRIAEDCRDGESDTEQAFWDGQIAALRDVKRLVEVEILTEQRQKGTAAWRVE